MTLVQETKTIGATPGAVLTVWGDYGAVDAFRPHFARFFILDGAPETEIGAERQCSRSDGRTHIKERVSAWSDGSFYSVEIVEGTMPIRDAFSGLSVEKIAAEQSQVTIEIGYTPKLGVSRWILEALFMKRRLSRVASDSLEGLRAFIGQRQNLKAEGE